MVFLYSTPFLLRTFSRNAFTRSLISGKRKTVLREPSLNCVPCLSLNSLISRSFCLSSRSEKEAEMVKLVFEKADGRQIKVPAEVGTTIKENIDEGDPDFLGFGACGGCLDCSTCHVIFSPEDFSQLTPAPPAEEMDMLDFTAECCETSRLACQVHVTKELDGAVIRLPSIKLDQSYRKP